MHAGVRLFIAFEAQMADGHGTALRAFVYRAEAPWPRVSVNLAHQNGS